MLDNLNWWEIGALIVVALLIFGDRLPVVISDGLRMLRNLRNMANNATRDLSRELGTDIQLADLHPKTFIRKHLLSEEDEAALRRPLEGLRDDLKHDLSGVRRDLDDVKGEIKGVKGGIKGVKGGIKGVTGKAPARQPSAPAPQPPAPAPQPSAPAPQPPARNYDVDAT